MTDILVDIRDNTEYQILFKGLSRNRLKSMFNDLTFINMNEDEFI